MNACRLIVPHADYEASHRRFLEEFVARGERIVPWVVAEPYATFRDYVAMLEAASRGIGLRDGGVPHSTFWWVDAQQRDSGRLEPATQADGSADEVRRPHRLRCAAVGARAAMRRSCCARRSSKRAG